MHQRTTYLGVLTLATVLAIGLAGTPALAQDTLKNRKLTTPAPGVGGAARPIPPDINTRVTVPATGVGPAVVPSTSDDPQVLPQTPLPQTPEVAFTAEVPCGDIARVQLAGRDTAEVPNLIALDEKDVHRGLTEKGLIYSGREVPFPQPTGTVFAQAPPAGTLVARGSRVLFCWSGPGEIPNVVHVARDRAIQTLKDAGYKPVLKSEATLKTALFGTVTSQIPSGNTSAAIGTPVTIVVAIPTMVLVPGVTGLSVAAAESTLNAHHLWGRTRGADNGARALVESQAPQPPDSVAAGSRVDLQVVVPPPGLPWLTLIAVAAGTALAAAAANEVRSRQRVRAIQVEPVPDAGRQMLVVDGEEPDVELQRRDFEVRPVPDHGHQSMTIEDMPAGKERASV